MLRLAFARHAVRAFGGCGGASAQPPKKKSVLEMFKSLSSYKEDLVTARTKENPHAQVLLGIDTEQEYQGHAHGDHAKALEADLLAKHNHEHSQGEHGHSHGDNGLGHSHGDNELGHSHGENDHGHSHGNHGHAHDDHGPTVTKSQAAKQMLADDPDDFIEMWNSKAPNGPEHGGPRGLEPTRYGQEWEKRGRVTDF